MWAATMYVIRMSCGYGRLPFLFQLAFAANLMSHTSRAGVYYGTYSMEKSEQ
jgi:hypothetical protein